MDMEGELLAKEIKGFNIHVDTLVRGKELTFVSIWNTLLDDDTTFTKLISFFRVVVQGKCNVYQCTFPNINIMPIALFGVIGAAAASNKYEDGDYCVQRNGSSLYLISNSGFKSKMKEFFWNCPFFLTQIKSGYYSYENWEQMIIDFNEHGCKWGGSGVK